MPSELSLEEIAKIAESDNTQTESMVKAVEDAQINLEKRYENVMEKFNTVIKQTTAEYDNYDEICELGDKINNGFGIIEDQLVYEIEPARRIRLTVNVLKELEDALNYFEEICNDYGRKKDQDLAAEYEKLTFFKFHFCKVFHEFNNSWLEAYILKAEDI